MPNDQEPYSCSAERYMPLVAGTENLRRVKCQGLHSGKILDKVVEDRRYGMVSLLDCCHLGMVSPVFVVSTPTLEDPFL